MAWVPMVVVGAVLAGWVWRGSLCEFRRGLPITARGIRTARLREGPRVTRYGRADLTERQFLRVAARLGLRFHGDEFYQAYGTPVEPESAAGLNQGVLLSAQPQPAWFDRDARPGSLWRRAYQYHESREAWYRNGTMYYEQTGLWLKDP